MRIDIFSIALLLCSLSRTFAQGPYDPNDNARPNNITGLNYRVYGNTGSYYNGSITFQLNLRDRNEDDQYDGTACHSFIGDSISLTYNAVAAITKNGADFEPTNPVIVQMYGVDRDFNLTWPAGQRNYSEHQFFKFQSAELLDGKRFWDFSLQNTTSPGFELDGHISKDDNLQVQDLMFNLTNACGDESGASSRDEDDYLFEGSFVTPTREKYLWESWTDSIPWPSFWARFDKDTASAEVSGLFSAHNFYGGTKIVGHITITFQGSLDELRSDELLIGGDKPEWNATLGFSGDPGLVPDLGAKNGMAAGWLILAPVLLALALEI